MSRWLLVALVVALAACTSTSPRADPPPSDPPSALTPFPTPGPTQSLDPGSTIQPCPQGDTTRLTALTLNIHAGRTKAGERELDRVADELRAWDADVVMLQEVDRGRERSDLLAQARTLGQRLGLDWAYGPTRRLDPGTTGNAVLSRFPMVDTRSRLLPRLPGLFRRGLLQATIDVDGREVEVLATHLDHVRPAARRAQAAAVASVVRRLDRPVLLGGDLNAEPGMPPLAILDRAGFDDPWPVVGSGSGFTVPAADPQRRIDYVLANDSFEPVRSDVLISVVSDHRAVRTGFELLPPDC